jgi:hypothetical protein
MRRLSRSLSRFETQDIKTQPRLNHYKRSGYVTTGNDQSLEAQLMVEDLSGKNIFERWADMEVPTESFHKSSWADWPLTTKEQIFQEAFKIPWSCLFFLVQYCLMKILSLGVKHQALRIKMKKPSIWSVKYMQHTAKECLENEAPGECLFLLLTPGLDNTRLFISFTAGAGTRCMSLLSPPPYLLTLSSSNF